MFCNNCGTNNSDNAQFCKECGAPVSHIAENEKTEAFMPPQDMFCNRCGAKIDTNGAFCGECGAPVGEKTVPPIIINKENPQKEEKPRKKDGIFPLIIILIVVIAVCVGTIWYFIGQNADINVDIPTISDSDARDDEKASNKEKSELNITEEDEEDEEMTPRESHYEVIVADATWSQANSLSNTSNSHLAVITSEEEFNKITDLANDAGIKVFWVGASLLDTYSWSNAKWITGEALSYTKWYPGEPSYVADGNEEKYLMVFCVDGEWFFNDAENDVSAYYKGRMGYIVESVE